jgi:hypothetical protein
MFNYQAISRAGIDAAETPFGVLGDIECRQAETGSAS